MAKTTIMATIKAKKGRRDEILESFDDLMGHVEKEEGCLAYSVWLDGDDVVRVFEMYEDSSALAIHLGSPGMLEFMEAVGDAVDGAPEVATVELYRAHGLEF